MQMTEKQYKEISQKLYAAKQEYEEALFAQRDAAEAGDLSENAEYETARQAVERLSKDIGKMESDLASAEIVLEDSSPRFTIGSIIDVTRLNPDGTPAGEKRRFRYDASGDTVMKQVLGVKSSLGQAIHNGVSGIYTIPNNGGIDYLVEKVIHGY